MNMADNVYEEIPATRMSFGDEEVGVTTGEYEDTVPKPTQDAEESKDTRDSSIESKPDTVRQDSSEAVYENPDSVSDSGKGQPQAASNQENEVKEIKNEAKEAEPQTTTTNETSKATNSELNENIYEELGN